MAILDTSRFHEAVIASQQKSMPAMDANEYFFPDFKQYSIKTSGATINTLVGGSGRPILLLHGYPETHIAWHRIANTLAQRYTVVLTDLRGYGDSSKPEGGKDHIQYSKREMGKDQVEVMQLLGFETFYAVGHDRGGRVLHQMMIDYPERIDAAVTLDIAPGNLMYAQTNEEFAKDYFWWFYLIQDAPLPEVMIGNDPSFYLQSHLVMQSKKVNTVTPQAYAEYLRCFHNPVSVHATCEDYRAVPTIDKEIQDAYGDQKISVPLLALWGSEGTVGRLFDVLALWRQTVTTVTGGPLPCGHLVPEEAPEEVLYQLYAFFG